MLDPKADALALPCRSAPPASARFAFRDMLDAGGQYRRIRRIRELVHPPFGTIESEPLPVIEEIWRTRFLISPAGHA